MDTKQLIHQHYVNNRRDLLKRIGRRAGTPENAEDVVQEAFVRALKYADSFDAGRRPFEVWFGSILHNALRDFKRDELNYGMCLEFDEEIADGIHMSQTDEHLIRKIEEMIDAKKDDTCEVLHLYFNYGYKPSEISEIMEIENKTIRMAVLRFKEEVRKNLGSSGDRIRH